jgi:anaerobic ribonucleoside-triphosphate reductase activating protein
MSEFKENRPYLNVAAICPSSKVLGPGSRFIVWVQGCCFNCCNCGSPEWRDMKDVLLISPHELAQKILSVPGLEGLTISGGEPFLQAENILKLVRLIRTNSPLSIICYTGFMLADLKQIGDPAVREILAQIDVLVDGPYVDELNDNLGWRGSTNQTVHFLSGLYRERAEEFHTRRRDIEVHLHEDHRLLVGIKPKGFDLKPLLWNEKNKEQCLEKC